MTGLVTTIRDKCRRCYSCVRNCPAKAIMVEEGQAKVIEDRCVGCGNCIRVCAQSAKEVESGIETVEALLADRDQYVIAGLAPSFPAAFPRLSPGMVIAAVRDLGFDEVTEVAFGAELVGEAYAELFARDRGEVIISTACPAVVAYVQKHMPSLVPQLAPLVSPMAALGRVIKGRYHPDAKFVFIGPCIAKKAERKEPGVAEYVDAVLTFAELSKLLATKGVVLEAEGEDSFDGPRAGLGRIFPVTGGLVKTAALAADVLETEIVVASGREATVQLLHEMADGRLHVKLLDVLFCDGCINGPRVQNDLSLVARHRLIADFAQRLTLAERMEAHRARSAYAGVNLARTYQASPVARLSKPSEEEIESALRRVNKKGPEDELNCGACGYATCRDKAVAVCQGLAEAEMCLPFLIEQLQANCADLERMHRELQEAQAHLIQSEKLASMGQLAAGVAHEVNNPLGTILLCSHMLLRSHIADEERTKALRMVIDEATRCKTIVSGLLNFARQGKLGLREVQLNAVIRDTVSLVERQSVFAKVEVALALAVNLPPIEADPTQLKDVFLNISMNAGEAMPEGGKLTIVTRATDVDTVEVVIGDTGCGIPEENLTKIFNPFFTTKQIGQGTGLGLAIAYGIVKMHRGQISVSSEAGVGSTFVVSLPLRVTPNGQWIPSRLD
ncbi:MAG: [Fe-Fe] hydrogenase large subunit C-terminal domain-containing protein [Chloroflexota bacterium]